MMSLKYTVITLLLSALHNRQFLFFSVYKLVMLLCAIGLLQIAGFPKGMLISLLAIMLYYVASIVSYKYNQTNISNIRTILDLLLIGLVLNQYHTFDILSIGFLLMPVFYLANQCDNLRGYVTIFGLYVIGYFTIPGIDIAKLTIVFFILACLNAFVQYRLALTRDIDNLNRLIDKIMVVNFGKLYKIYDECIPILNKTFVSPQIRNIYCFRYEEGKFRIANGSTPIFNFELDTSILTQILRDNPNTLHVNVPFKINGEKCKHDYLITFKIPDSEISYIFIADVENSNIFRILYQFRLMISFLSRLSRLLEVNYKLRANEIASVKEMTNNLNYINAAQQAMHFIKNKLSPVKNYFAELEMYEKCRDLATKERMKERLDAEKSNAEQSFTIAINRANYIVSKMYTSQMFSEVEKHKFIVLLNNVRDIWQSYGFSQRDSEIVDICVETPLFVTFNRYGMDQVLTNWISNMNNYGNSNSRYTVNEDADYYILRFINATDANANVQAEFVKCYNQNDRDEIIKRNWHGLMEIKEALEQMNIPNEMSLNGIEVLFEMRFKKLEG